MAGRKKEDKPIEGTVEIIPLTQESNPILYARQKEWFNKLIQRAVDEVESEAEAQKSA